MAARDPSARALLAAAAILLAGCATVHPVLERPAGFAEYRSIETYRAVSPEGVAVRVRLVRNDPPQSLEFWTEALKTQLISSGYAAIREEAFDTRAGKAVLLEWAAPVGEEDWVYLTGIVVTQDGIAVAEAAGAYAYYQKHREALLESLRTLEVR